MKHVKEVNIAGLTVHLAYCYATETGFRTLADEDIRVYLTDTIENIKNGLEPDKDKAVKLLLAAATAYSEGMGVEEELTAHDLMYEAEIDEIFTAVGAVIQLYMSFYKIPSGEPKTEEPDEKEEDPKNT